MSLDDIRDTARAAIHEQFSIPAVVRSPDGSFQIDVQARLHNDLKKPFGDLDREGFALMFEYHNQVIFDSSVWFPKKNWTVDFDRGRKYNIISILDGVGQRFIRTEVTEEE